MLRISTSQSVCGNTNCLISKNGGCPAPSNLDKYVSSRQIVKSTYLNKWPTHTLAHQNARTHPTYIPGLALTLPYHNIRTYSPNLCRDSCNSYNHSIGTHWHDDQAQPLSSDMCEWAWLYTAGTAHQLGDEASAIFIVGMPQQELQNVTTTAKTRQFVLSPSIVASARREKIYRINGGAVSLKIRVKRVLWKIRARGVE